MTSLEAGFEDKLAEAVLPDRDETQELAEVLLGLANDNWRAYATANGYDIDHITEDAEITDIRVENEERSFRIEWPFSAQFEFGVDPHVIRASDAEMLKFPWPDGPEEVLSRFEPLWNDPSHFLEEPEVLFPEVNWGSETGGIPKARAVRDALMEFRGEYRA